jgi:putative addiction module killer protein
MGQTLAGGSHELAAFPPIPQKTRNGWGTWQDGNIYVTILEVIEIREYLGLNGNHLFGDWFSRLNAEAARKVTVALYRLGLGNFSNVKGVGGGVFECRIDFGSGYRIYFGKDGEKVVILLVGGTKKRQQDDIAFAGECWLDYKKQRRSEPWR